MNQERDGPGEPPRPRLVLATANRPKLAELARILADGRVGVDLVGRDEFPGAPEVAETGATFAENALLKGRAMARFTGLPAVAEDSGLCVDAMNGMPGVLSARWAGRHGDDEGNLRLVLAQLADVPDGRRGAYFRCAAALVLPSGQEHVSEGTVYGRLIREPRGSNGFGYDPIFVPDASELARAGHRGDPPGSPGGLTTAEMTPEAKDAISHRGRALRALAPVIAAALG
jgi:XTP/dITP diphosphohydrolase